MSQGNYFNLGQSRAFSIRAITEEQAIQEGHVPSRSILAVMDELSITGGVVLVDVLPAEGKGNTLYVLPTGQMVVWREASHQWQYIGGGGSTAILYDDTGSHTDGAMTQKATTEHLELKVNKADFLTNAEIDALWS